MPCAGARAPRRAPRRALAALLPPLLLLAAALVLVLALATAADAASVVYHSSRASTSRKTALRDQLKPNIKPVLHMALPQGTERNGVPGKVIFVFGPESTGTRFMSRSISKLMEPASPWDGENPPCRTHVNPKTNGYVNVQHISLPWGWWCQGHMETVQNIDFCNRHERKPTKRFFVDVEEIIRRNPNAKAIVLTRDPYFALQSVLKIHCKLRGTATQERDYAFDIINRAVNAQDLRDRIMHVEYEVLGLLPVHTWMQISEFLDLPQPTREEVPKFESGNKYEHLKMLGAP